MQASYLMEPVVQLIGICKIYMTKLYQQLIQELFTECNLPYHSMRPLTVIIGCKIIWYINKLLQLTRQMVRFMAQLYALVLELWILYSLFKKLKFNMVVKQILYQLLLEVLLSNKCIYRQIIKTQCKTHGLMEQHTLLMSMSFHGIQQRVRTNWSLRLQHGQPLIKTRVLYQLLQMQIILFIYFIRTSLFHSICYTEYLILVTIYIHAHYKEQLCNYLLNS